MALIEQPSEHLKRAETILDAYWNNEYDNDVEALLASIAHSLIALASKQ